MKKIVIPSLLMVPVIFSQNTVTKVVDPGGKGDFTSLQAWALWVYTQTAGNLVASNVTEIARCICTNGQADTQPISGDASFVAFTTDATHYIKIYADTNYNGVNYRNRGVYPAEGSNIYRLECLSKNTPVLGITTSKVIIDGICIENILPDSSYSGNCIQLADCDQGGYVTNCILLDNKTSIAGDVLSDEHGHGIRIDAAYRYSKYYIHNNIIIGFRDVNPAAPPNCGILIYPTTDSAVAWIDNNTIFDCEYGVWNRGGMSGYDSCRVTLRNNIFQDTAADWHSQSIMGIQYTSASSNNVYLPYCTPLGVIPITNNGFEDTTSVEPFVNGDVASESYPGYPVHTGMHSLEVSAGWNSIDIYTASITGLQANTVYSLSFYDAHGWGNGFNVSVKSASYSSSTLGSYLTSASDSIMTNHTIVFNSGNNTSVIIDINGGSGGGAYYFDDFFMYPGI